MFRLAEATDIIQGSTKRTWNCVLQTISTLWEKFNYISRPIMPKARKRNHSRSKSRSHSRERDLKKSDVLEKDGKRRKIDSSDSPYYKRSVSSDNESKISSVTEPEDIQEKTEDIQQPVEEEIKTVNNDPEPKPVDSDSEPPEVDLDSTKLTDISTNIADSSQDSDTKKTEHCDSMGNSEGDVILLTSSPDAKPSRALIISKKRLTPKQLKIRMEVEKKREEKLKDKEERKKQRNAERERIKLEKLKKKEEKRREIEEKKRELEQKQREKDEQKRKEKEEREQKRKEKEEKEEMRKKERELELKEKQKEEEKKQKTAAAFKNFFVKKTTQLPEDKKLTEDVHNSSFMAFEVKSDMRLASVRRRPMLIVSEIEALDRCLKEQIETKLYLDELKSGKSVGKSSKTWPYEEELSIVEDSLGDAITEEQVKFRAKFFKFHDNRRPPYYGTWRKKSKSIKPRKPFTQDEELFNYEEDSDDDWEEEEQGESLNGSEDEADKENDNEENRYDVDNEFVVPHGHLSDDEIDSEEKAALSPETLKMKLKLLKDEFEQDMQCQTHKLKPRYVGCIWYNKDGTNVEEPIDRYLKPLAAITNGQIIIKNRSEFDISAPVRKMKTIKTVKTEQELDANYVPSFLKFVHGRVQKKRIIAEQFVVSMAKKGENIEMSKAGLMRYLKQIAIWKKCDKGVMKNKWCWCVLEDVAQKYNVQLNDNEKSLKVFKK